MGIVQLSLLAALPLQALAQTAYGTKCSPKDIAKPSVFGAEVLSVEATPMNDFGGIFGNNICYVTVMITHPGTGDRVNTFVGLPLNGWNGVFQGIGGGGYIAGLVSALGPHTALGYSGATTDAGHSMSTDSAADASPWALASTGNVDQYALLDFAHRSLHDMTVIGKAVSKSFYGQAVKRSYWNGCSTGGRQGLAMAQYYPDDYDGILADAPAIQWNDFIASMQWPYTVQNNEGYAPKPCEFDAVLKAMISSCDSLDGLRDNVISAPGLCDFQASSLVGKNFTCDTDGSIQTFSHQLANVVNKIWQGPRTPQGQFLWYGLIKGADFSTLAPNFGNASDPVPFLISDSWYRGFLAKNLTYDTANISYAEFAELFLQGHIQYDSIVGTASPDIQRFANRGGKMITWQGLADPIIPPQGTMLYYEKVLALDPSAANFYRMFFSPGVGHCGGGTGVTPTDPIGQLRAWVENGTAPASLHAGSEYPVNASSAYVTNGTNARFLDLCPYPKVQKYSGKGSADLASSWTCVPDAGWEQFSGPSGHNYSCVGGPGWY